MRRRYAAADPDAKVQCVHLAKMYADADFNTNCQLNGGRRCDEVGGSNPGGDDYYVVAKTHQLTVSPEAAARGGGCTS